MPDGRDNKPRYKSNPIDGKDNRGAYTPRGENRGSYKPRDGNRSPYKPRDDSHGSYKPRDDSRGSYKPRSGSHDGFHPPAREDNRDRRHESNPQSSAFNRYSDRNSVRVIDRGESHRGKPFGDSFDRQPRPDKPDRFDRSARPDRTPRPAGSDRPTRPVRFDQPPRGGPDYGKRPAPPRPIAPREPSELHEPRRAGFFTPTESEPAPNLENILSGRNPIREALRAGRDLEKLMVAKGDLSGSAREIVAMAREKGVPIHEVDRVALERLSPAHQGLVAIASAYKYSSLDDILARAAERGEEPLVVILDGITDPHNLGAIIRSAECAGAHGVIIPERRAAGLTAAAVKASAGAIEHLPVARVTNIVRLLAELKEKGLWILSAHTSGEDYTAVDLSGPVALVVGSEGEGVSRLVLEKSDKRVMLPIRGRTESLNASVAAGILLYEVVRRRLGCGV